MNGAAMMVMKLMFQSKFGAGGGGKNSGGLGSLLCAGIQEKTRANNL